MLHTIVEVSEICCNIQQWIYILFSKTLTQHAQPSQGQYGIAYLQAEPVAEADGLK